MAVRNAEPSPSVKQQLFLMRHAKSSWSTPGQPDNARPLNDRGRRAAPEIGKKLRDENYLVDLVMASTAIRVRETLELLLPAWGLECPVVWEKHLYLATPDSISQLVGAMALEWPRVLVVGHNPGLSDLASQFSQEKIEMPTAALVILENDQPDWPTAMRSRNWHLSAFWKPREL